MYIIFFTYFQLRSFQRLSTNEFSSGKDYHEIENLDFLIFLNIVFIITICICCFSACFYCYKNYPKRRPYIICLLILTVIFFIIKRISKK